MRILRLIIFTFIIPGTIAGYIPHLLYGHQYNFELGVFKYLGLFFMALGLLLYVWSALSFLLKGKGTPAIWFTKKLKFIIGKEPANMVSSGLYRISRNPMYFGMFNIVMGEAFFFESKAIFIYAVLLMMLFHLVVVLLEEPHLKKKYGAKYEAYLKQVPRWFGAKKRE